MRSKTALAAAVTGTLLVAGSVVVGNLASADPSSAEPSVSASVSPEPTPSTPPIVESPSAPTNRVDKVIVIPIENHSAAQVKASMKGVYALGEKYGKGTNFRAITHPSQPNYIALSSGSAGKTGNSIRTLSQPDIWNGTLAAKRTMKVYVDGLPTSVSARRKDKGAYAARHVFTVPFVATKTKAANFAKYTIPSHALGGAGRTDATNGKLPNVGAIIPNNQHNWHDGSAAAADKWITYQVKLLQSGPDWKSGKLAIIITADEDNKKSGNLIPLSVIHPGLKGKSTSTKTDLYSLGGFLADAGHTPRLGKQKTAPDFAKAFGLKVL